jgi:DNA-binding response OmpR family regulator
MVNLEELLLYTKELEILFAEDHDDLRHKTNDLLQNFFKKVVSVDNGKKALELYQKNPHKYDIVLSDIEMPHLNGIELTQEIYKLNPKQSIIILSAYDETEYLLPLINLGIEQFLKKPIDYEALINILFIVAKKIKNIDIKIQSNIKITKNTIYFKTSKKLLSNKEDVYLTKFEILLLDLLTNSDQKIYSNETIVSYFQSHDEFIDPQNIRKLVSKLRKKLPKESLKSVYGVGYRLITL